MKTILLLFSLALCVSAQTALDADQARCPSLPGVSQVMLAVPLSGSVVMVCAQIDPAGFTVDKTTTPWTLRAVPPVIPPPPPVINFAAAETPGGAINGSNLSFTLANSPVAGSLQLFRNGMLQTAGVDYSLAASAITFMAASIPQAGDGLTSFYRY